MVSWLIAFHLLAVLSHKCGASEKRVCVITTSSLLSESKKISELPIFRGLVLSIRRAWPDVNCVLHIMMSTTDHRFDQALSLILPAVESKIHSTERIDDLMESLKLDDPEFACYFNAGVSLPTDEEWSAMIESILDNSTIAGKVGVVFQLDATSKVLLYACCHRIHFSIFESNDLWKSLLHAHLFGYWLVDVYKAFNSSIESSALSITVETQSDYPSDWNVINNYVEAVMYGRAVVARWLTQSLEYEFRQMQLLENRQIFSEDHFDRSAVTFEWYPMQLAYSNEGLLYDVYNNYSRAK